MSSDVYRVHQWLAGQLRARTFAPPVTHVYNPLEYAKRPLRAYLDRYASGPREVLLLGMNPGPFGMAQTGVPFGDPAMVRGWLGIEEHVDRPKTEHPKRPVMGFDCPRREVSGERLWGWARATFDTPARFFSRFTVLNYCPLVFMEESGRNRTPDKLASAERELLFATCDEALRRCVGLLEPRLVVGVGAFAERRAREALSGVDIGRIPHPSPASPLANGGWARLASVALRDLGVSVPEPQGSKATSAG